MAKLNPKKTLESHVKSLRTNRLYQFKLLSLALFVALVAVLVVGRSMFVVAFVNGKPILRGTIIASLEKQGGTQVLDSEVTRTLILDYARKNNINISDEETNAEIDTIKSDIEAQGLTLEQALSFQGQTIDQLREDIYMQLIIEQALSSRVEVTDEEVQAYFEENGELLGEDAVLGEVSGEIRDQLTGQKLSQEYQTWITELKESANIQYLVDYAPQDLPPIQ